MSYQARVAQREIPFCDDDYTKQALKKVALWLTGSKKPGLLLYGNFGNGKTTMANSACDVINFCSKGLVNSISARDLSRKAKDDPAEFHRIIQFPMLFIDDFGWEPASVKNWGNEISPIVEAIEERYKKLSLTILTSNKTDEQIKSIYHEYVYERITEMFDKIYYTHKSYRR